MDKLNASTARPASADPRHGCDATTRGADMSVPAAVAPTAATATACRFSLRSAITAKNAVASARTSHPTGGPTCRKISDQSLVWLSRHDEYARNARNTAAATRTASANRRRSVEDVAELRPFTMPVTMCTRSFGRNRSAALPVMTTQCPLRPPTPHARSLA